MSTIPTDLEPSLLAAANLLGEAASRGEWIARPCVRDPLPLPQSWPLASLGFERWCSGESRAVFLHRSGWCLKAPLSPGCEDASRCEMRLLATLGVDDRALFAETYLLSGDVILQRTYSIDPHRYELFGPEIWALMRVQLRLRVTDIHEHNVGFTADGRAVFIDWAGADPNWWHR